MDYLKKWRDCLKAWRPLPRGPFTVLDRARVYSDPWIKLTRDQVMSPDYRLGSFTVVRIAAGVGVLPIDDEGNVYLNREFKYAVNKISIEAPSGSIAAGESPFSTAKRELREELGIEARVLNHLGRVDPHTTNVDSPAYLFLARGLSFKKPNRDVTEFIEPLKIKLAEAVEMVMNGTITYAQSIAVILKSNEYLKRSN